MKLMAFSIRFHIRKVFESHKLPLPLYKSNLYEWQFLSISGSAVIRMLAAFLGPDSFRQGLRLYLDKKYANQSKDFLYVLD